MNIYPEARLWKCLLFGLALFILCATAIFWLFVWRVEYRMDVRSVKIGGWTYDAGMQWKRHGQGQWELVHGFIFKFNTSGGYEASCGSRRKSTGSHNAHNTVRGYIHVSMTPEGLYANRKQLIPTADSRIFILSLPDESEPVKMTHREMALFHPDAYPFALEESDLWRSKLLPLVNPDAIAREQRLAAEAAEQTRFETLKDLGIYLDLVYGPRSGDLIYYGDFYKYPNGTSKLANAIFASQAEIWHMTHTFDLSKPDYNSKTTKFPENFHEVYAESFPSFCMIDGKKIERNKVYVFRKDGTVGSLDLTEDENRQLTYELFKSPEKLKATEIYRKKIAPAIGAPIDEE